MHLFEYNTLSGIHLQNRFVRSATNEGMAALDGLVTPELCNVIRNLALGGVGLIISGHSYVSNEGQANSRKLAVDRDECIPGLKQLTEAAHQHDAALILQLAHAGAMALDTTNAIGPSPIAKPKGEPCREMTDDDIKRIIDAFAAAASRGKQAGFDGVQIHAAHGYLLSEFLSPHYNRRTDEYGGNITNRSRIVVEILRAIKKKNGTDFPVFIKINSEDFIADGMTSDESLEVVKILQENGLDAVEISGGLPDSIEGFDPVRKGDLAPEKEIYYQDTAKRFKAELSIPVVLVGGIRTLEKAEKVINEKMADYVALSRPLIREPDLIKRWQSGDSSRAKCISCNQCFRPIMTGRGLLCMVEEKARKKMQ